MKKQHIGRNEKCPCGSGTKYKRCCGLLRGESGSQLAKVDSKLFLTDNFAPVHSKPAFGSKFTVEIGMYCDVAYPVSTTLFAVALDNGPALNYSSPIKMDSSVNTPILRLSFLKNQLKPLLEIQLTDGSVDEVWLDEQIRPRTDRPYQIAFSVNSENREVSIYVDGIAGLTKRLKGHPTVCGSTMVETGAGNDYQFIYNRVWRELLGRKRLKEVAFNTYNDAKWDIEMSIDLRANDLEVRRAHSGKIAHYAQYKTKKISRSDSAIAYRVLYESDNPLSESCDEIAVAAAASETLINLVGGLRSLIDSRETTEIELLAYFKENPTAAFLLCPLQEKQWREELIQDFGQIDFVFKIDDELQALEIESPKAKLFKQNDEFTLAVNHAIDQVEKWYRGAMRDSGRVRRRYGIDGLNAVAQFVIIGRSSELNNVERKDRWKHCYHKRGVRIKTWDEVINEITRLANRLKNATVSPSKWSN